MRIRPSWTTLWVALECSCLSKKTIRQQQKLFLSIRQVGRPGLFEKRKLGIGDESTCSIIEGVIFSQGLHYCVFLQAILYIRPTAKAVEKRSQMRTSAKWGWCTIFVFFVFKFFFFVIFFFCVFFFLFVSLVFFCFELQSKIRFFLHNHILLLTRVTFSEKFFVP